MKQVYTPCSCQMTHSLNVFIQHLTYHLSRCVCSPPPPISLCLPHSVHSLLILPSRSLRNLPLSAQERARTHTHTHTTHMHEKNHTLTRARTQTHTHARHHHPPTLCIKVGQEGNIHNNKIQTYTASKI